MRDSWTVVSLCVLLLLQVACGLNRTLFLSASGDDSRSGLSRDAAWATFDVACARLEPWDTLRVLPGAYLNQSCSTSSTGVTITADDPSGSRPVLDGLHSRADGIVLDSARLTLVGGLSLRRFRHGVVLQNDCSDVEIRDFDCSEISEAGVFFRGRGASCAHHVRIHDFEVARFGNRSTTANAGVQHEFGFAESHDIEVFNFHVHDAWDYGAGIRFRNVRRLHLHDGRVANMAYNNYSKQDGISLGSRTYDTVIERVTVNYTGWHGIGLQNSVLRPNASDSDDPDDPAYRLKNITIRNCTVGFPHHNAIDLHTGNDDVLLQDVFLFGDPLGLQGVNYMHSGERLRVERAVIQDLLVGMYLTEPNAEVWDCEIRDVAKYYLAITDPNVSVHNCLFVGAKTSAGLTILQGSDNFLIDNCRMDSGKLVRISGASGTLRDLQCESFPITGSNSTVKIEYTDGRVFTTSADPHLTTAMWSPTGTSHVEYSNYDPAVSSFTVRQFPLCVRPSVGDVTVKVRQASAADDSWNFTVSSFGVFGDNPTLLVLLTSHQCAFYNVSVDGLHVATMHADSSGVLSWLHSTMRGTQSFAFSRPLDLPLCHPPSCSCEDSPDRRSSVMTSGTPVPLDCWSLVPLLLSLILDLRVCSS